MKMLHNNKGISQVPGILLVVLTVVLIFGIIGIASVYMGDTMADITADQESGSVAEAIGNNSLGAIQDISEKQDSMSGVVVAGIIISILLAAFGAKNLYISSVINIIMRSKIINLSYWNSKTYGKAIKIKKNYIKAALSFICLITPGTNWLIPIFLKIIKNDYYFRY
jgi:hypothetical protein